MPRQGQYTKEHTNALLKDYVQPQECSTATMPRDLSRDMVLEYIRNEVKSGFNDAEMGRATRVARFYVLREAVDQFIGMLNTSPKDAKELRKTCHLIVAACELGNEDQQKAAAGAYTTILNSGAAEKGENLEVLVETFFYLPSTTNKKTITDRVSQLRVQQERKGNTGDLWQFEECERRLLPRVLQEKGRRDWFLKMPAGPERTQQFAEAYLMFEMHTPFKWDEAAGFALLRVARDEGDKPPVEAIKAAMNKVDPKKDDPDLVKFRKTRSYAARAYFLDTFDGETKRDAKASAVPQDDLIQ